MEKIDLFRMIHFGGVAVYGAILVGSCLGLALSRDPTKRSRRMKRFLTLGPLLGLSMGAIIGGAVGLHYLAFNGFHWPESAAASQEYGLKYGLFAVLWISHFHLEIWTQEPLRQQQNATPKASSWSHESSKVWKQMALNSALFLGLVGLSL